MTVVSTIAIDGPAGAGKSTVGHALARRLGFLYFDTGIMYRAVAWIALRQGVAPSDAAGLCRLAHKTCIEVMSPTVDDGRANTVLVDGEDVTWAIRCPEVDATVSEVSAHGEVREALTRQQRAIGQRGRVVMVGRDIGSVVLPDADLKVYLTASAEERARRRLLDLARRGVCADFATVLAQIKARDAYDSGRDIAPLRAVSDAVVIDSDGLTIEQEVEMILDLVLARCSGPASND